MIVAKIEHGEGVFENAIVVNFFRTDGLVVPRLIYQWHGAFKTKEEAFRYAESICSGIDSEIIPLGKAVSIPS